MRPLSLCAAIAIVGAVSTAVAQPSEDELKNAARELAREGVRHEIEGDWDGARDLYHRAHQLVAAPSIEIREARALAKLGKLIEAAEAYNRVAAAKLDANAPDAYKAAVAEARQELPDLRARIPRLTIALEGIEPRRVAVHLDGDAVPAALVGVERPINPGTHRVEAFVDGAPVGVQSVALPERDARTIALRIEPARPAAREPSPAAGADLRTARYAAFGVGAAGLAVGVTGTIVAASTRDDLDTYAAWRTTALVGYGVAFVGAATGATLFLLGRSSEAQTTPQQALAPRVVPWIGPGSAGVAGSF